MLLSLRHSNFKLTSMNRTNRTLLTGLIVLLVIIAGAVIYRLPRRQQPVVTTAPNKEEIRAIHEREVRKAVRELEAEKRARIDAEETRKKLLKTRTAELDRFHAQLREIASRKGEALAELDNIRRPHLFWSRAKKEAKITEQLERVERLDADAIGIKNKLAICQAAIDTLSLKP